MLLIPDVHINSKYCDAIIDNIKKYISENNDEENIVFLWDYVYHFSYDRDAILKLYNLFLELFDEWKNVYVLAGNHDRLGQSFVFEEAKKAFDIIEKTFPNSSKWKMKFITEPMIEILDWKKVLFFPFSINNRDDFDINFDWTNILAKSIQTQISELKKSSNKREYQSACINYLLLSLINDFGNDEEVFVVTHHYFDDVQFPWLKAKFAFKNIALSKYFLDFQNVRFISGHLHSAFSYKNYICLWSAWNTSPLEVNEIKFLAKYSEWKFYLTPNFVNPYFVFDLKNDSENKFLSQELFDKSLDNIFEETKKFFSEWSRNICFDYLGQINYKQANIVLKVDDVDYSNLWKYVDEDFNKNLNTIKLQKESVKNTKILDLMKSYNKWEMQRFSDWKDIVSKYIEKKYPDDSWKYMNILNDLKLV